MTIVDDDLISIQEIAKRLGISERTVFKYLATGVIPGRKLGSKWLVLRSTIDRILEEASGAPR